MANPYPPNYGPPPEGSRYPALDGLRALPAGAARPSPYGGPGLASERLVELPSPLPVDPSRRLQPPPQTPPNEEPFGVPRKLALQGLMTALPGPKLEQ